MQNLDVLKNEVGSLTDFVGLPYSFGDNSLLAHMNTSYYHVHGKPFVYPSLANEVTLTSGSGSWDDSGAKTEVIPADTLTDSAFDLHWINISQIGDVSQIQIDIYTGDAGSEVWIGGTRSARTTNQARNAPQRIQVPQLSSGTRISCRLSDSTSGTTTCNVSFEGHYYTL
jgi:hypothetical protein